MFTSCSQLAPCRQGGEGPAPGGVHLGRQHAWAACGKRPRGAGTRCRPHLEPAGAHAAAWRALCRIYVTKAVPAEAGAAREDATRSNAAAAQGSLRPASTKGRQAPTRARWTSPPSPGTLGSAALTPACCTAPGTRPAAGWPSSPRASLGWQPRCMRERRQRLLHRLLAA